LLLIELRDEERVEAPTAGLLMRTTVSGSFRVTPVVPIFIGTRRRPRRSAFRSQFVGRGDGEDCSIAAMVRNVGFPDATIVLRTLPNLL
jgi:hypothetical protein